MPRANAATQVVVQNAAKTLLANIRFASVDTPVHSLVVTSSVPNEGKSTVCVNLAEAIATSGKSVLLVECDMRRRSLADLLGVHARTGIYGVLAEQSELEDAVVATGVKGMYFLDSEPHIPNPADILSSRRFRRFLENAQKTYDYVLIDTPPVGTFVDAAVISSLVDATALVVREGYTKRQDVAAAYEQLKKADANVIGAIMNFCETESSEYYYAYYNKDGKRVRKENYVPAEPAPMPAMRGHAAAVQEQNAEASGDIQSPLSALPKISSNDLPRKRSRLSR